MARAWATTKCSLVGRLVWWVNYVSSQQLARHSPASDTAMSYLRGGPAAPGALANGLRRNAPFSSLKPRLAAQTRHASVAASRGDGSIDDGAASTPEDFSPELPLPELGSRGRSQRPFIPQISPQDIMEGLCGWMGVGLKEGEAWGLASSFPLVSSDFWTRGGWLQPHNTVAHYTTTRTHTHTDPFIHCP